MIFDIKKWISFFDQKNKIKFFFLILLVLTINLLEVLGIGIIYPLLDMVSNQKDGSNLYFKAIRFELDLIELILILLILYFLKFITNIFFIYLKNKMIYDMQESISTSYYISLITKKYKYFLDINTGDIINDIQVEISYLVGHLKSVISIITDFFLLLFITVTLLYINIYITLSTIFIGVLIVIPYLYFAKKRNKKIGSERKKIDYLITKIVKETFSGIKHVKISKNEKYFINNFSKNQFKKKKKYVEYTTFIEIPRVGIEYIIITILLIALYVSIHLEINLDQVIPLIGVFVAASFKLIPGLNKISNSIQNIHFYNDSLNILNHKFNLEINTSENLKKLKFNQSIQLNNICFKYPNQEKYLFENQNIIVKKNKIIGIEGISGEGKSTLINIISGLLDPENINLIIDKKHTSFINYINGIKVGYVSQDTFLLDDSIKKNIAFGIRDEDIDHERLNAVINQSELNKLVTDKPNFYDSEVGENGIQLSGGQIQRIGIARALYDYPEILVLDEFTSSLDLKTEMKILKTIKKLKKSVTIILTSHKKSTLKVCDEVYLIKNGKVILDE